MTVAQRLYEEALALEPDERVALAHQLLDSADCKPDPGYEAAWDTEIARRLSRIDDGTDELIPWAEVRAKLFKYVGLESTG